MPGPFHVTDPLSTAWVPLPYGLLEVASVPADNADPHWQRGVAFQSPCVSGATTYDECLVVTGSGAPPAPASKVENVDLSLRGAMPFTVLAKFDCSPVGTVGEREALAEEALAAAQGWQVERAVWTGVAGGQDVVFPSLTGNTAATFAQGSVSSLLLQSPVVTGNSSADDAITGLGILEGLLADCHSGVGVIHVPQRALPTLWPLLRVQGGRLKTLGGFDVAVGAGYPGTGPGDTAADDGEAWIYGTGPVFAYRAPTFSITDPRDALDRSNNTLTLLAERTFAVGWGCCHFGVRITLGSSSAGGGGGGGVIS